MRKQLTILSLSLVLSPIFASVNISEPEYNTKYTLYYSEDYKPNGYCDVGMYFILSSDIFDGGAGYKIAKLNDFVSGACQIKAKSNYRTYKINPMYVNIENCGCGTVAGSSYTDGYIEVTLHSEGYCKNQALSAVSIREFSAKGEVKLSSFEKLESTPANS